MEHTTRPAGGDSHRLSAAAAGSPCSGHLRPFRPQIRAPLGSPSPSIHPMASLAVLGGRSAGWPRRPHHQSPPPPPETTPVPAAAPATAATVPPLPRPLQSDLASELPSRCRRPLWPWCSTTTTTSLTTWLGLPTPNLHPPPATRRSTSSVHRRPPARRQPLRRRRPPHPQLLQRRVPSPPTTPSMTRPR